MPPRTRAGKTPDTAETPTVEPTTETQEKREYAPRGSGIESLAAVNIRPSTIADPFKREPVREKAVEVPDDHPIVLAIKETYDADKPAEFPTTDPDAAIRSLRRIANHHLNLGVKVSVWKNGEKVKLPRTPKGQPGVKYNDLTDGAEVIVVFQGANKKAYKGSSGDDNGGTPISAE